jgi:hypothetical protein
MALPKLPAASVRGTFRRISDPAAIAVLQSAGLSRALIARTTSVSKSALSRLAYRDGRDHY